MQAVMPDAETFKTLYLQLGLGTGAELAPLHQCCPHAQTCWQDSQNELPERDEPTAIISHPWVGSRFSELGLLCLGINMNDYGGFTACKDLVDWACEQMEEGRIRVLGDENYIGTLLYHRMGMYSALIAQAAGFDVQTETEGRYKDLPTHTEVVRAFEFLAYSNQIKCSPTNENRSQPSWQMWQHCGKFILTAELQLLQPRILLVLGSTDNYGYLVNHILDTDSVQLKVQLNDIQIMQATLNTQLLTLVVLPHPSYAVDISLMYDLQTALSQSHLTKLND